MLREGHGFPVVYVRRCYFADFRKHIRFYFLRFGSIVVYSATGEYEDLLEEDQ